MDISNKTDYPIAIQMNFDPQKGSMYTFGEVYYIIPPDTTCELVTDRYVKKVSSERPFNAIWETPDDKIIYCKLYRVNPDTYKEEELLAEWNSSQSDESSFFNERSWRITDCHYNETAMVMVGIYEWTFYINEHLIPTLNE